VGPGTGSSLARCFHKEGYKVAMIARNRERLDHLESELENSKGFICDVRNIKSIEFSNSLSR
jgi:short-subunit dehydrogenase